MNNLYHQLPRQLPQELIETIGAGRGVRIERIVSTGHASPPGFWYDQDEEEFVVLLRGAARLQLAGEDSLVDLVPGNYFVIPAHARHRVVWTTPDEATVWLAVFYHPQ